MNSNLKYLGIGITFFVMGFGVNNYAISDVPAKIAVVDVQQVVSTSPQVLALKQEQQTKTKEIINFIEKARKEVAETTDVKKKQSLEEKYNKELQDKKAKLEQEYVTKLSDIDNKITNIITNQAKSGNYDIVLAKGIVLYGGEDITSDVSKEVSAASKKK